MPVPHAANVPGDFYVEDGCCVACDMPRTLAPQLFGMTVAPNFHCYVKQQPETETQLEQMYEAIECADLECIRYRGTDRLIQLRLIRDGQQYICDNLNAD
jgi:hypothetical protein